ncbi:MAG TPA: amidohydrolase family protein [Steroidobacteraceae bacterium]|nr:amidohydrolase family protein [Steroidobacteraceae bacterium]
MSARASVWVSLLLLAAPCFAQDAVDGALMNAILQIPAIDNHMHADPVDAARPTRWKTDNPLGTSRYPDVAPLARDHIDWQLAWEGLYGLRVPDLSLRQLQDVLERKKKAMAFFGDGWPEAVLKQSRVDVALVNTVRPGTGLDGPRFRWVPYADPLLRPFSGDESRMLYTGGDTSVKALLGELGLKKPPPTLARYREQVIAPTLARWKSQRGVAVKFLSAYARPIDFDPVDEKRAAKLYAARKDSKLLEDYLFNEIAAAAGRAGLVVHVHTGNGDGPYFNNGRANPGLLENTINSKPLRQTKFVLLHGGWPDYRLAQAMTDKPNTYVDFSAQTFYLDSHHLSDVLRSWLSWHPEKVLFGSDAYSDVDSPLVDWEEKEWACTYRARWALGLALTAMVNNREISRDRALELARMVLHDNAASLYGL